MKWIFVLLLSFTTLPVFAQGIPHSGIGNCIPQGKVVGGLNANASPTCVSASAFTGGVLSPEAYGASHSQTTITCQTTATSNQLACSGGTGDFSVGEDVEIASAGNASPLTPIGSISLTVNGTPGSTTYTYAVCTVDPWKGIAGCAQNSTSTGPATLSLINSVTLSFTSNSVPAARAICYRKIGAGSWQFIPCENEALQVDIGYSIPDAWGWPASPPAGAINQDFWSTITNISGTIITLADNVPTSLSSTTVSHDDALAWQLALNAGSPLGVAVVGEPYTYNINRPVLYNTIAGGPIYTFTASTPHYPNLFPIGYLLVPSHSSIGGAGKGITQLVTSFKSGMSTFGFNVGQAQNPFQLNPQPTHYALNNAVVGSNVVTTTTAGDAANFETCNKAWIWGGASVAGNYYPSQLRHPIAADPATGNIQLDEPLIKPVPEGTPGANPTIMCIDGQYVSDITISDMTVKNHSTVITNGSAVDHIHFVDVNAPWQSELAFWQGGFSRDWTMDRCNFVSLSDEIDLQDDVRFSNGSWEVDGGALNADEASGNIQFDNSVLTMNELYCGPGATCGVNGVANFGATLNSPSVRILNNRINCNTAATSNVENQSCVAIQSGALAGFTSNDDLIEDNQITSTAKGGIEVSGLVNHLIIARNHVTMNLPFAPLEGLLAKSGVVDSNTYIINSLDATTNGSVVYVANPPIGSTLPLSFTNNTAEVIGAQNYIGLQVADPGGVYDSFVTVKHNHLSNFSTGINVSSATNTPTRSLGNDISATATPFSPAFNDQTDNEFQVNNNIDGVNGAFIGSTIKLGSQLGTAGVTPNPTIVMRSDFGIHPSTFNLRYTDIGKWSEIFNINQSENSGGTWQEDAIDTGSFNLSWEPNGGSSFTLLSHLDTAGDLTLAGYLSVGTYAVGSLPATCTAGNMVEVNDWAGAFVTPAACSVSGGGGTVHTLAICQASNVWNCL